MTPGQWRRNLHKVLPHTPSSNAPRSPALVAGIVTPPPPDERRGVRTGIAARIALAIEARSRSVRCHACAKKPARPAHGTNPVCPGDAQSTAELPRSLRSSALFPWGLRHSYVPLQQRSHRRSLGYRLRIPAFESKPDTPGFCPDPTAARIASCGPERFVAEADPAATARCGVMAHFS